ncbi:MAG TPA: hypothetical protein VJ464_17165 [Blastocatellia bacterium]|nr:hypothetical protein [Blastocatellia bacterium]
MNYKEQNVDPIPPSEYPTFQPCTGVPPVLPSAWECVALLHPFSPLQSNSTSTDQNNPFFELCVAYINYQEGQFLSAQITGISGRTWWYVIYPWGTYLSTDIQPPNCPVDMGWTLPDTNWFGNQVQNAACAGISYLNWMEAQQVAWWKMPVPNTTPPAATWMWFDAESNLPVRLMFGQGPPSPSMGDPNQLALFQMFSFTYFPMFNPLPSTSIPTSWATPQIEGFSFGNPKNYELFTWNTNFGMTVFMTPVNEKFNPLPTRVLYVWKPDNEYHVASDRAQSTLMMYNYNPQNPFTSQVALLTGAPPTGVSPPPNSDSGFLINYNGGEVTACLSGNQFPFPEEPPYWVSIPGVQGTIQATVADNPVLCPENTVTILSVLFPPSAPNYPDSTYLWTWYSPLTPDGTSSRPVTFMQSQSGVGVGTSLALADYFYYQQFTEPINPSNFDIPAKCLSSEGKKDEPSE